MRERSPAENAEDIAELRRYVDTRLADMTAQIQQLQDRLHNGPWVRNELHDEQVSSIRRDIAELRQTMKWTLGLIISGIVGGIASAIAIFIVTAGTGG